VLGRVADATSIDFVYHICAFLPAIGLLAAFLPNMHAIDRKGHVETDEILEPSTAPQA
jgi:FSR family fosmidomycin resistance protein-like MFS transporter